MKRVKKSEKLNNSGFSLVEVLVAVIILALITGPILMAFVMSAKFNKRARTAQQVNTVAESVMEKFKGRSIDEMASDPYFEVSNLGGIYTFKLRDVDSEEARYDVRVTATPMGVSSSDIAKDLDMLPSEDFVYNQDFFQDISVYSNILGTVFNKWDEEKDYSRTFPELDSAAKAKINVERVISVNVTGDASNQHVAVTYTYKFSSYNYSFTSAETGYHVSIPAFTYPDIVISEPVKDYTELKSVYLCYSPGYAASEAKMNKDTINITNSTGLPLDFYLLKQKNTMYSMNLLTLEAGYRPNVSIGSNISFHHNLHTNLSGTSVTDPYPSFTQGDSVLVKKETVILMYDLSVQVFADGAYEAGYTGTPLIDLKGTMNSD